MSGQHLVHPVYETIQNREHERPHPATSAPKLPEYCVRPSWADVDQVGDEPLYGARKHPVACAKLGVSFLGVELDRAYLEEAVARTRQTLREPTRPSTRVSR